MNSSELSIQCWNIHGIFTKLNGFTYNKLQHPDFINHTLANPIFGLVETNHVAEDIDHLQILGFKCFQTCRKKLKYGRKHGGLAVYISDYLLPGIDRVPTQGSETIVIKLKKDFFRLPTDIFILFSYCVPANSSYTIRTQFEPFTDIEQKIGNLGTNSNLICFGDYNARTGDMLDYIESEDNTDLSLPDDYVVDTVATYPRGNLDNVTNKYGESLISLCKNVPLRICNGRKLGDVLGSFTCHNWNGQSAVDYCLASPDIYHKIKTFKVNNFLPTLSDHCSIEIKLRVNMPKHNLNEINYQYIEKPTKVSWDKDIALKFENIIQNAESKNILLNFAQNGIEHQQISIDNATNLLSDFIVNSAIKAGNNGLGITFNCPKRSPKPNWKFKRKPKSKTVHPKWHDATCESLNKRIKQSSYLLSKHPNNPYLKKCLTSETKQYKKLVKSKHKEYIGKLFDDLDDLHKSNPRGYMNLVKSLRDGSFDKKVTDNTSFISPDRWRDHFVSLLSPLTTAAAAASCTAAPPARTAQPAGTASPAATASAYPNTATSCPPDNHKPGMVSPNEDDMLQFIRQNCEKFKSNLDLKFTRSQILEGISTLENNKASSFDRITNEMLKTGKLVFVGPLGILFNAILSSTLYPSLWKPDILTPLHKSAEKK